MNEEIYAGGAILIGFITFVGTWIWCIAEYGFLLGVGLGWLPSLITAVVMGLIWPLLAIGLLVLIGFIMMN
jgi:hypothetical protein